MTDGEPPVDERGVVNLTEDSVFAATRIALTCSPAITPTAQQVG
jgi:hypothetical protein